MGLFTSAKDEANALAAADDMSERQARIIQAAIGCGEITLEQDEFSEMFKVSYRVPAFEVEALPTKRNYRSAKMLAAAKGQSCVNCGANDGTVVAAHYQGVRGLAFGRGTGIKAHDLCVADLCSRCHEEFDSYKASYVTDKVMRRIDLSERFMFCVLMTLIRRVAQGVITIKDFDPSKV